MDSTKLIGAALVGAVITYLIQTYLYSFTIGVWKIHSLTIWILSFEWWQIWIGCTTLCVFPKPIFSLLGNIGSKVLSICGSAIFAARSYISTLSLMKKADNRSKALMKGWKRFKFFNRWNRGIRIGNKALKQKDSFTTLIHGGTGSGKSETIAAGTLFHSIKAGASNSGSVICSDPQNQLWKWASGYFNREEIECIKFSPSNPDISCGFNPIALAAKMGHDGADILASTFVNHSYPSKGKNAFFVIGAETILKCVIKAMINLYATEPQKATMSNAYRLLSTLKFDRDAAANYILSLLQGEENADTRTEFLASIGLRKQSNRQQKQSASVEDVIQTARSSIAFFSNPIVEKLTCKNDINFDKLRTKRQAIFLNVSSTEMIRYAPLLNVLFSWLFEHILKEDDEKVQKQNCITILLEEAGTIGAIKSLDTYINLSRKLNTNLYMIAQDPLLQFESSYGVKEGKVIYHTMQCHIIIAKLSVIGAKSASELIGKYALDNGSKKPIFDQDDIMNLSVGEGIIKAKSTKAIHFNALPFHKIRSLRKKSKITTLERSATSELPIPTVITNKEIQEVNELILNIKKASEDGKKEQKPKMEELPPKYNTGKEDKPVCSKLAEKSGTRKTGGGANYERDTDYQQTVF